MKSSVTKKRKTIPFKFGQKHKEYMSRTSKATLNIAEGAIRAGKTVDNVYAFAYELKKTKDRMHLATGSTVANAKLNIGDANGFGLEFIFRGQCRWSKYKDNEALIIKGPDTNNKTKIVIFAGGAKADSYKKVRGNSYGMWIATEINLHHDNTIKEAFNRTAAARTRKFFWDLNPDHPNHTIYTDYIDKYLSMKDSGKAVGGVNYMHFTIDDNETIPAERKAQIKAQYDPKSIWYLRDILGKRVVAEGLIYKTFVDGVTADPYRFEIESTPGNLMSRIIGVDFGGNKSNHSMVCTGITWNFEHLIGLKSKIVPAKGTDPEILFKEIYDFTVVCIKMFGAIDTLYCDSAEQVLINGIRTYFRQKGLNIRVENALKMSVNERINLTELLIAMGRFKLLKGQCDTLVTALSTSVWDPKMITENVRLDDGTSDIDTLDAFEYSFERFAAQLVRR